VSKQSVRQTLALEVNSGKFDGTADEHAALNLLRSCIAPYPALEAALFPVNNSEQYPMHGDAIFCRMLNLFQDSVPLRICNVLGSRGIALARRAGEDEAVRDNDDDAINECEAASDSSAPVETEPEIVDELPNFCDQQYAKDAYQDQIDISYYLSEGQPTKAYELFCSERRSMLHTHTHTH
jgi:hypothetical protein